MKPVVILFRDRSLAGKPAICRKNLTISLDSGLYTTERTDLIHAIETNNCSKYEPNLIPRNHLIVEVNHQLLKPHPLSSLTTSIALAFAAPGFPQ
ncbi:MAG: hypothetical protein BWY75_00035 [bacterium ADurb.Bin425]|nr:MAG: hypothetical protein BWY75_00035 [bacterium ADurb.Bin425]